MGLGLLIDAPIPPRGWRKRLPSAKDLLTRLEEACCAAISDDLFRRLVHVTQCSEADGGLDVRLHPGAAPVEFRIEGDLVTAMATTTPAGPGYHAFVVDWLERVGERLQMAWCWDDRGGGEGDECGYHETRDFAALQREMLSWLRAVCGHVVDMDDHENIRLGMPMDFAPALPDAICTPLGPRDFEWARTVSGSEAADLERRGESFFSWWGHDLDAEFWKRYALALCWTDIGWHVPQDNDERRDIEAALAAFARSSDLDPEVALPDMDIAELRRFSQTSIDDEHPPRPDGIGYRRGTMEWSYADGWNLAAPGFWHMEEGDGAVTLWFGERAVRATVFTVKGGDTSALALAERGAKLQPAAIAVGWESPHIVARGGIVGPDDGLYHLNGVVAVDGSLCTVTLTFREGDRQWAEDTFRRFHHPLPSRSADG
jgi:hypothetical protein